MNKGTNVNTSKTLLPVTFAILKLNRREQKCYYKILISVQQNS